MRWNVHLMTGKRHGCQVLPPPRWDPQFLDCSKKKNCFLPKLRMGKLNSSSHHCLLWPDFQDSIHLKKRQGLGYIWDVPNISPCLHLLQKGIPPISFAIWGSLPDVNRYQKTDLEIIITINYDHFTYKEQRTMIKETKYLVSLISVTLLYCSP